MDGNRDQVRGVQAGAAMRAVSQGGAGSEAGRGDPAAVPPGGDTAAADLRDPTAALICTLSREELRVMVCGLVHSNSQLAMQLRILDAKYQSLCAWRDRIELAGGEG